jgi:hypothetical protein
MECACKTVKARTTLDEVKTLEPCALHAVWLECQQALLRPEDPPKPIPMILTCPKCSERHIDEGEFAERPHETHACQHCGLVWKPAKVPTVGVRFLPGYGPEDW